MKTTYSEPDMTITYDAYQNFYGQDGRLLIEEGTEITAELTWDVDSWIIEFQTDVTGLGIADLNKLENYFKAKADRLADKSRAESERDYAISRYESEREDIIGGNF